jgi:hypothetical protein
MATTSTAAVAADVELFEREIRPVLVGTCFRCHGGERTSGGLRIDSRESLLRGGESGPALVPADAGSSLLIKAIEHDKDVSAMPPGSHLKAGQIAAFKAWINAGAEWPESAAAFVSQKHWSLGAIADHAAPEVRDANWRRTSVDAFILAKLEAEGLSPKPEADRRTLIRRVTYDLTGLPPAPADVDLFVNDPRDNDEAFAAVVDRLLASPAYGEHWGRHWLDVVRYADTAGENSDHPLPHAWKYRNWVIDAFNTDKPYDAFVREQLAGDLLPAANNAEYAANHIATTYLAIARRFGHDIDKDIHLTREDQIDNFGKTFLGLSLGCCRCHDHKYDPLPAEDYYGLYGVFDSTKLSFPGCEPKQQPADLVALMPEPDAEAVRAEWRAKAAEFDRQIAMIDAERANHVAVVKDGIASVEPIGDGTIPDGGAAELWRDGRRIDVHRGEIIGLTISPDGNYGADTTLLDFRVSEVDGFRRTWTLADTISEFSKGNPVRDAASGQAVWCFLDPTNTPRLLSSFVEGIGGKLELKGWRNEENPSVFVNTSSQAVGVWTTLPAKAFCVHPGPESSVAVAWISPVDGVVSLSGRVTDGHPGGPNGVGWRVDHVRASEVARALDQLAALDAEKRKLGQRKTEELGAEPRIPVAYAAIEGTAHNSRLQQRGNPEEPGDEVVRHFPQLLGGALLGDATHSGRLELAGQLTRIENPLVARVMANRVWQWHFGRGIVATPNDFGSRGAAPTHPELLDHLAVWFRERGWSVKDLTREIVMSATYRQASDDGVPSPLYAGFSRRRLSAEELRDTLLFVSAQLDRVPGEGHPFPPESSWGFTQHGPFAAEYPTRKRSVYMLQKRNRRARFFALFDGADPNVSTPVRDVTTVPTQALYFMNDPFVHESAAALIERVSQPGSSRRQRLDAVYRLLFGRTATDEDEADFAAFERDYLAAAQDVSLNDREGEAWRAYARGLLASNELLYVD